MAVHNNCKPDDWQNNRFANDVYLPFQTANLCVRRKRFHSRGPSDNHSRGLSPNESTIAELTVSITLGAVGIGHCKANKQTVTLISPD